MLTIEQKAELRKLQKEYNRIKKEVEHIKQVSRENEIKVLTENNFTDDDNIRVTDYSYMIQEKQFDNYMRLHAELNKKSGLEVIAYDQVIEYQKEQELKEIEKQLFKLQLLSIPANLREAIEKAQKTYKYKNEALKLILEWRV